MRKKIRKKQEKYNKKSSVYNYLGIFRWNFAYDQIIYINYMINNSNYIIKKDIVSESIKKQRKWREKQIQIYFHIGRPIYDLKLIGY